jgi:hypothetical protein
MAHLPQHKEGCTMRIRIYTCCEKKLIGEYNVKSVFEPSFYHRNVPYISGRRCAKILNELYPHYKVEKEQLVFEKVETGFTLIQYLHRSGTLINL